MEYLPLAMWLGVYATGIGLAPAIARITRR